MGARSNFALLASLSEATWVLCANGVLQPLSFFS
jgi:hypothetical protein